VHVHLAAFPLLLEADEMTAEVEPRQGAGGFAVVHAGGSAEFAPGHPVVVLGADEGEGAAVAGVDPTGGVHLGGALLGGLRT
jgi:hypothetical protein